MTKPALSEYTVAEVESKVSEIGSIRKTAEFYGVSYSTIRRKIGLDKFLDLPKEKIERIREMAKTMRRRDVAKELKLPEHQIVGIARINGITFKKGRRVALAEYTQDEVREKARELGRLTEAAKFYGVSPATIRGKIGDFQHNGVLPEHIEEVRKMSQTHTRVMTAKLLGYTVNQIIGACEKHNIKFKNGRKPRKDSELSHYEMNNMDKIVKQYKSVLECALEHNVSTRCIEHHIAECRKARKLQEQAEDCELLC